MIQGGWLASTRGGFPALLRQRSDPQQVSIFCCNFEVIKIHPQNVNILLKKKTNVMIKTLVRADMLERTGILITEDMSRRAISIL